jgi:hypothetical protein
MNQRTGIALVVIGVLAAVTAFGFVVQRLASENVTALAPVAQQASKAAAPNTAGDGGTTSYGTPAAPAAGAVRLGAAAVGAAGAPQPSSDARASTPIAKAMIVTTATMDVRVKDVVSAVEAVRKLARDSGAQVADLTYAEGGPEPSPVQPTDNAALPSASGGQPPSAQITLRVPAAQLEQAQQAAAALGDVTAQTSTQGDVTAQHADMAARLRNMRAEEARLRALFAKAGGVSDLLEVEQQLSGVRGDIESAQAQLDYLDRQVALSTLEISLSQPGAIVRPASGASWGIADAVTQGVRSAVAVVRALIVGGITLLPVALLLLLARFILRLARRARRTSSPADAASPEEAESVA